MVGFGSYLKDYLEFNNISQTEFADRIGVTQKHLNELLNGKTNFSLEKIVGVSQITNIPIDFILKEERRKYISDGIIEKYGDLKSGEKELKKDYHVNELERRKWVNFQEIANPVQVYIDLIDFLHVYDLDALKVMQSKTLFKKQGNDINKLSLWIARCDELSNSQKVLEYDSKKLPELIEKLKLYAYENEVNFDEITQIFNEYGIYFVHEKALEGSKVRGCFKVKGKNPAIYVTQNYKTKDSLFFEIFHELGHCKSNYNEAKSKVIVDGNESQEKRADEFAINSMIDEKLWNENAEKLLDEKFMLDFSKKNKIPTSFIVGRLAMTGKIKYSSKYYNKYKK